MCRLRGRPRSATGQISLTADRIHLQMTRDTNGPGKATCREPLTERRAEAVTGIRQHTAEANTGCDHAINLSQRDLWLGPRCAMLDWNTGTLQTRRIARPTLGNEETQCHHYRHFTPRKRQRHQRLAIGRLAERRGILRSDTNRTIALLRHRGVVDDQHRILAADEPIGLNEQFRLQWRRIPDAISDEMVQLVIVARRQPRRHRLHALAIARSNQPRNIKRTHPPPRLVT